MSRTVLVLSLGLLSGLASAQERPNEDFLRVWGQHASAASGAKGPQEIPYGSAMERFFWTIGREHGLGTPAHAQRLRTVLPVTDADARVIGEIAAQSYDVSATVRHEATVQYDELCAQLLDSPGTRNAVDVGMQFNAVERRKAERLTAHYQAALARLSPAARAALNAHVDNSVWPKM